MIKFDSSFLPFNNNVVMCSGGVDSIAAVHYLLTHKKNFKFSVFHYNHNIRPQNNTMEEQVRQFCSDFNINLHCDKAKEYGAKAEKKCRDLRLQSLEELYNCDFNVITAHHMNDVVEQYLMNCFRGLVITHPIPLMSYFTNFVKCHCFLMSEKKDFIQYVQRNNLEKYIIYDETNDIIKGSRRNWVRHKISPELKNVNINLVKTLRRKYIQNN